MANENQLNMKNIRLRRMFQTDVEEETKESTIADEMIEQDLERVVLRFNRPEEEQLSLADSLNQLIKRTNSTPTQSLLDYIEDLQSQYEVKETVGEVDDAEYDIVELIKQSEAEILQEEDQRSVLYRLIHEVTQGVVDETNHELVFEENLQQLYQDEEEEDFEASITLENKNEDDETQGFVDEIPVEESLVMNNEQSETIALDPEEKIQVSFADIRNMSPHVKLLISCFVIVVVLLYIMYQQQIHSFFNDFIDIIRKMF